MPLPKLQDKRSGELNATLLGSVDEQLSYASTIIDLISQAMLTPLTVAVCVLCYDWRLGLMLLLLFPALAPLYRVRRAALGRGMRMLQKMNSEASADVLEFVQGLPVLRAFCDVNTRTAALEQTFTKLEQAQTQGYKKGEKPNLIITSIVEIGLLLMCCGSWWVTDSSLNLAALAAVAVIVVSFGEPLSNFIGMTSILELTEGALARIDAILAEPELPQRTPEAVPTQFDIAFEQVHFAYGSGESIINGLSATLPANSMIAIVGLSGSGKSTLMRLLMRYADPQSGSISIGGVDICHIPPEKLSGLISTIFQDVYLFDDTVRANIRMARPDANDAEIEAAARAAECLDFINRLPHGWDTTLGEIGSSQKKALD